jgi:hypothetical protein
MRRFVLGCSILVTACGSHSMSTPADGPGSDAAVDTPVPDGPVGVSCTGLAYCDDFESYGDKSITNGATVGPWTADVHGVTIAIDATNGYNGGHALHITVPAGATVHGWLGQTKTAGLLVHNNMYGRAMVYYSNSGGNDLPKAVHSWFFETGGTSSELSMPVTINMGTGGPNTQPQLNYHPGDISKHTGTITAGAWHCVQWQYDGSGTPPVDTAKMWVDGTVAINVAATDGWKMATPWTAMMFGFTHYQTTTNPVDMFLDDFAVDNAMIPCPP